MELPSTIAATQDGLVKGDFKVIDLVEEYLKRIKSFDKDLNAFITVTDSHAINEAKKADEIISNKGKEAFKEHPLLGTVFSMKDVYLTKGIKTTAASKVLENYIPQYSSTVYERLERAGAILIGKNNCDAWAHGASGENSDFGPTKNPWNKEYVPGGSSSGPAAAVAADMALFSMGTDTGGSIRQPASFTNLVGFKPTYGAVPRYGVVAMASSLDSMGHFTHTVEDTETIFNVTKGEDAKDATLKNSQSQSSKSKFKVGIPKEYFGEGLDAEVKELILSQIEVLKNGGIEFVEVSIPHTKYAIDVYYIVQPAEVSSNLGRYDGIRYGNDRIKFGDEAKRRIMLGTYVLSSGYYDAYYAKAMKVRSLLANDFEKVFEKVDALIAPVSPTPPFKIGEKSDDPLAMYLADIFSVSANLVGIPGLSIPAGFAKSGLPVGFQIMGPRFGEHALFEIGKMYQHATSWHKERPKLHG